MAMLGIIGGLGPESTIDYYRSIIARFQELSHRSKYPPLIINSIDVSKVLGLIGAGELSQLTIYLARELDKLARAGATIALLAANAPHIVFDDVQSRSSIPLISIVETTCKEACSMKLRTLGLLGTRFVMQGDFYQRVFARSGLTLVVPTADEQGYIHEKYMNELLKGTFLPETRQQLLSVVERLVREKGIEGTILAGTELPLILRDATSSVPLLDTAQIHVNAAVNALLS